MPTIVLSNTSKHRGNITFPELLMPSLPIATKASKHQRYGGNIVSPEVLTTRLPIVSDCCVQAKASKHSDKEEIHFPRSADDKGFFRFCISLYSKLR